MSYLDRIARAIAAREGDVPAEQKSARRAEPEHCCHCDDWHDPQALCAEALWDAAVDLLYRLREAGATVSVEPGAIVSVRGLKLDAETVEALKAVKSALIVLLGGES